MKNIAITKNINNFILMHTQIDLAYCFKHATNGIPLDLYQLNFSINNENLFGLMKICSKLVVLFFDDNESHQNELLKYYFPEHEEDWKRVSMREIIQSLPGYHEYLSQKP